MKWALTAFILVGLACAPHLAGAYYATLALTMAAYVIALLGLNLLFGYGGLMSLGHAMFMAMGAYAVAVLGRYGIVHFEIQLLVAASAAAAIAALIGLLCIRYADIFFSMLTLSFGMIFHSFLFKFYSITGGESGMRVGRPLLLGMGFQDLGRTAYLTGPFYAYAMILTALLFAAMALAVQSPYGLTLRACRDNRMKAEALGVNTFRVRYVAFVVSAAYCAIGGAVLAVAAGNADPDMAFWTQSGDMIFIVVLGGLGRLYGPLAGSVTFTLFQDLLMANTEYWRSALGASLAVIVLFAPRGISGLLVREDR